MVGKCDPSLNGDFCNVSLSRLLWFTGLFSVMTIKDDNQNEISWHNELGKKKRKSTNLTPKSSETNKEKRKKWPWTVATCKHEPDRHEREQQERPSPCAGSPSTRLPCPQNPFGTCPGTWWTNRDQSQNCFVAIFLLGPLSPVGHLAGTGALHRTTDPPKWKCVVQWDIVGYDDEHSKMKCLRNETKY